MIQTAKHCAFCKGRDSGLISEICPSEKGPSGAAPSARQYAKGEILFKEGGPANGVYCVTSGSVRLFKTSATGFDLVLRIARTGDLLGYRSIYAGEPFSASAQAREATRVCYVDKLSFMETMRRSPSLAPALAQEISKELGRLREELMERRGLDAGGRLAACLLRLAKPGKNISATRREISDMIGTAPETVSRLLKKMEGCSVIQMEGRDFRVSDRLALEMMALGREGEGAWAGA